MCYVDLPIFAKFLRTPRDGGGGVASESEFFASVLLYCFPFRRADKAAQVKAMGKDKGAHCPVYVAIVCPDARGAGKKVLQI
jgi:hypothetical protein